jgi:phosphoribosylanthranilate isomerase
MCGTTRPEDARAAVRYGVDALGFIFYDKSPRYIPYEKAARIIAELPPLVDRVGVFVGAPIGEVVTTAAKVGLSALQLHGRETVDYCREIRRQLPHCRIIKAFRVSGESRPELFSPYNEWVDAFLLDTYVPGASGGTGKVFDWSVIERLKLQRPVFLAGGLSPENVLDAIAVAQPFAVDINSGIESQPGVKDHLRLKELLRMVYQAAL